MDEVLTKTGWDFEAASRVSPQWWSDWVLRRTRGDDPFGSYRHDERDGCPNALFLDFHYLTKEQGRLGQLSSFRKGVALAVAGLDPVVEDDHFLCEMIDLAALVRAREENVREALRGWLDGGVLLSVERRNACRAAVFALAALQERGSVVDDARWREWMLPGKIALFPNYFLVAAFSGLAISREHVPVAELLELFRLYRASRMLPAEDDSGVRHHFLLSPAVLALWVEREAAEVERELRVGVRDSADWDLVVLCASKRHPAIKEVQGGS